MDKTGAPSVSDPPRPSDFRPLGPAGAAALLEAAARDHESRDLELEGHWGLTARLTVRSGRVLAARAGRLQGADAVMRIFLWPEARYRWTAADQPARGAVQVTIEATIEQLINEGLRHRAVWQTMLRGLPSLSARLEIDFGRAAVELAGLPPPARSLCRLCDGQRTIGEVLRDCDVPDLEAASTIAHLLGAGVLVPVADQSHAGKPLHDEVPAIGHAGDYAPTGQFPVAAVVASARWPLVVIGVVLGIGAALWLSGKRNTISLPPSDTDSHQTPGQAAISSTNLNIRSVTTKQSPIPNSSPGQPSTGPSPTPAAQPDNSAAAHDATPSGQTPGPAITPLLAACERARAHGDARRILSDCDRALAGGAERPDLLALLAELELERGHFAQAAARARRAIALDPKLPEAYAYLGFAEAEAGGRREALAAYRKYLALAPRGRYAADVRAIVRDAGAETH
jgi:hypothetical protein